MTTRDDEPGDRSGDAAAEQASAQARAEAEDRAWREIVDHYGEGPDVESLSDLTTPLEAPRPTEFRLVFPVYDPQLEEALAPDDDEPFTPPPLPPPAVITPERRLAWVGLVASPLLLIAFQLLDYPLPGIIDFGLVVAFLVSFGYLVATMAPRDPDDDGARV